MPTRGWGRLAGLTTADLGAVLALRPEPATLAATMRHPHAAVARSGADAALAPVLGAVVWLAACWLAAGLLAAAATRLPGPGGRRAASVCRRLLPRALRGVLAGSAGLGVLLAPVAAAAHPGPARSDPAPVLPSPAWPVQPSSSSPPSWPITAAAPRSTPHPVPPTAADRRPVTVHRGDSLWSIAAGRLGHRATPARVAAEWPRWFAANRAAIGADPAVIRPGQVLQPPDPARRTEEARR